MSDPSYIVETRQQIANHLKKSFEVACQKLGLQSDTTKIPAIPQLEQRKLTFLDSSPMRFLEIILTETSNRSVHCQIELDKLCQKLTETPQLKYEREEEFVALTIESHLLSEMTSYVARQLKVVYQEIDRATKDRPHKIKDSRMPWEKLWG